MIEYRKATIDDIEEMVRVRMDVLYAVKDISSREEEDVLRGPNRDFIWAGLWDGSFCQWLAMDNDKIIGTSSVSFYNLPPTATRPNGKTAYVGNMFTYPEYRGKGIGMRLLSLAVEEAKSAGCMDIRLDYTEMGKPLYEKFGFKRKENAMIYLVE